MHLYIICFLTILPNADILVHLSRPQLCALPGWPCFMRIIRVDSAALMILLNVYILVHVSRSRVAFPGMGFCWVERLHASIRFEPAPFPSYTQGQIHQGKDIFSQVNRDFFIH